MSTTQGKSVVQAAPDSTITGQRFTDQLRGSITKAAAREFADAVLDGRNICATTIASVFKFGDAETKPHVLAALKNALGNQRLTVADKIIHEFDLKKEEVTPVALAAFKEVLKKEDLSEGKRLEAAVEMRTAFQLPANEVKSAAEEAYDLKIKKDSPYQAALIAKTFGLDEALVKKAAKIACTGTSGLRSAEIAEEFGLGHELIVLGANSAFSQVMARAGPDGAHPYALSYYKDAVNIAVRFNLGRKKVVEAATMALTSVLKSEPSKPSFGWEDTRDWIQGAVDIKQTYRLEGEAVHKIALDFAEKFMVNMQESRLNALKQNFELPKAELTKKAEEVARRLLLSEKPNFNYVARLVIDFEVPKASTDKMVLKAYEHHISTDDPGTAAELGRHFCLPKEKVQQAATMAFDRHMAKGQCSAAAYLGKDFNLDMEKINEAALKAFEGLVGRISYDTSAETKLIENFKLKPEQTTPLVIKRFEAELKDGDYNTAMKLATNFNLGSECVERVMVSKVEDEIGRGYLSAAARYAREYRLPEEISRQLEQLGKLKEMIRA
ncbi:MAG: hypothetical protein KGH94_04140 [Candidatus Micrarchaeota archaeon]|nr:hypothetical protein [Candidatus Micrarchaeota archaeon]